MSIIHVNNISKAYKVYKNRWSRLVEWILPWIKNTYEEKWIIKDVSFSINPGESVGIIGINGAGKSTLLKMITGTTHPTKGKIEIAGKIAALLELGMGFHPDFTGRQNVYMAGQLLGLTAKTITDLMPEIEDFAEIGDYINQPVRVYSSGMQMRLAFSIATAVRPDILIVDEALSVGDTYFQHKSFERIRKFKEQGTTLLIVSHDKQAIQNICDRAILLNQGRIELEGNPETVMDYYNAMLANKQNQDIKQTITNTGKIQTVSGTGEATVANISLIDEYGQAIEFVNVGQKVLLRINVQIHNDLPRLVLGYGIKDRLGQVIYGTNTDLTNQPIYNVKSGTLITFDCVFDANLGPGSYSIQTALVSTDTHLVNNYEWRDLALIFNILNKDKNNFSGVAWLEPKIGIHYQ